MKPWLAIESGGDAFSVALDTPAGIDMVSGRGGAHVSAALVPAILSLLGRHGLRPDALGGLAFGCGPGSFTGVRTACAVTQGLAWGAWGAETASVLPVESLMAVAEDARRQAGVIDAWVAIDARMGELYAGHFRWSEGRGWQRVGEIDLIHPGLARLPVAARLVGNALVTHGEALRAAGVDIDTAVPAEARADAVLRLVPQLLVQGLAVRPRDAHPVYVRDRVALTTAERAQR